MALAVGQVTVGVATLTLKLVLCVVRLKAALFGFRARVAVRVSALVTPVKMRLLKLATSAAVVAVEGFAARSELASVALTLTVPGKARPLSVTVTAGAGDIAAPATVPVEGGSAVKLSA
jgi:hypothetical protein